MGHGQIKDLGLDKGCPSFQERGVVALMKDPGSDKGFAFVQGREVVLQSNGTTPACSSPHSVPGALHYDVLAIEIPSTSIQLSSYPQDCNGDIVQTLWRPKGYRSLRPGRK